MHRSSRRTVVRSDEDRAAATDAVSATATPDALDLAGYYPVTPSVYTEQVLGVQTWLSGKPELRYVGLRPA